jgi:hypothetical protein
MDVRIEDDELVFGDDGLRVSFKRTLRIPDDGKKYPLPPGLGAFPIRRVEDFAARVPNEWRAHGGVFLPMYQREAMWLFFRGEAWKPRAVKVGVGKVCAITGLPWSNALRPNPQDYLVTPPQPWLDGICVGRSEIRQFVAMPLGLGYTVEGQMTGEETHGGLQLRVFEPRPGRFRKPAHGFDLARHEEEGYPEMTDLLSIMRLSFCASGSMGLAAGGRMRQKIYPDPHGIETWSPSDSARVWVHLVNSALWREITGEEPPATPVTAKSYAQAGLPWFKVYDEVLGTLDAQQRLAAVRGTAAIDQQKSTRPLADDETVEPRSLRKLWGQWRKGRVRDGIW